MSTSRVVNLIRHHRNETELNDNAVQNLQRKGYTVRHLYPFEGDTLDAVNELVPSIVLGGGQNVTELSKLRYLSDELRWIEASIQNDMPLLGICLGAQLIAHSLGAVVGPRQSAECEYGFYEVRPTAEGSDFLPEPMTFMQAHTQEFSLPEGATRLAYSERFPQQAFQYGPSTLALQFHPEVNQSIFNNWLADDWSEEMVQMPGAQPKREQSQQAAPLLLEQGRWFDTVLDRLFP